MNGHQRRRTSNAADRTVPGGASGIEAVPLKTAVIKDVPIRAADITDVPVRAADIKAVIAFLESDAIWTLFTERGLAALSFAACGRLHCIDLRSMLASGRAHPQEALLIRETIRFLKTGRHKMPLDFSACSPFQQRVYEAVAGIRPGRVCTYKHVAMMIGQPLAARAVGNALAREPFDYFLPAHRVVPQGGLGLIHDGSGHGRLQLLAREGHDVSALIVE